jgi:Domain of unknown function (DUF932)
MLLTESAMELLAPSMFSDTHKMSELYKQVRTIDVVRRMSDVGYHPVQAKQDNPTRRDPRFVTHMVVLRHQDHIEQVAKVGNEVPQIIIINSHNGRRKLTMMGGIYRFVCANGLFIGDNIMRYAGRHSGNVIDEALNFAGLLSERMPQVQKTIEDWSAKELSPAKQTEFAKQASVLRWGDISSYDTAELLKPRRAADEGSDLWRTFNVVQENCFVGGLNGTTGTQRSITSKPITQINRTVDFNRGLWELAEQFA